MVLPWMSGEVGRGERGGEVRDLLVWKIVCRMKFTGEENVGSVGCKTYLCRGERTMTWRVSCEGVGINEGGRMGAYGSDCVRFDEVALSGCDDGGGWRLGIVGA